MTSELIREAIDRLSPEEQVTLTPCIPWKSPWGDSTSLGVRRIENDTFCLIAYFKDREHSVYISPFVSREEAVKALIDYFEKYEVPNPSGWNDHSFLLNQDHSMEKYVLYVDERPYEYITYDDVMASWDDLNEGKCTTIMLHTPTCQNGYMQVSGSADNYTVEVVGLDRTGQVCGYRIHTRYGGHVTHWLYDYYHEYKFPEFRDDWVNITEELRNFIAGHKQEEKQ